MVHCQLWPCAKPSEPKTFVHQVFHGLHLGKFVSLSNPHINKTTNLFFHKTPHQPTKLCRGATTSLPCANPSELKTFMHQEFNGLHLGRFVSLSNPHISKTTNFIFSQNSPPTNQVMQWCADKLAMGKPLQLKTFVHQELNGLHLGTFLGLSNPHISKTTNFIFSQNSPPTNQVMPWCTDKLAMCKPLQTKNFRAPRT